MRMKLRGRFQFLETKMKKPKLTKKPLQVEVSITEEGESISENLHAFTDETLDVSSEQMEIFKFTVERVYLLASIIGDTTKPFNTYKGHIGRFVWILNIIIHFSLDFYEATHVFHASWATSIGIYLFAFVLGSVYTIRYSIPCFIKIMKKLVKEGRYEKTFTNLKRIFKIFPYTMPGFTLFGALAQFGCYAYDGALRINFNNKGSNSTKFVPEQVEQFLNVLRMTSLLHIFYAFWLFLLLHLVLLYTLQVSMKEFNTYMTEELKKHPPKLIFSDAVALFSKRTRLLSTCSEKYTPVLAIILVATSVSFVVNAYNFLFVRRFAIYVWFALTPLIWTVTPLLFAAWVTMTYRQYKYNVIQAWVEIPEMYDEIWERHFEAGQNKGSAKQKQRKSGLDAITNISDGSELTIQRKTSLTRKESLKVLRIIRKSIENLRRKSDVEDLDNKESPTHSSDLSQVYSKDTEENNVTFTDLTKGTENNDGNLSNINRNTSETYLLDVEKSGNNNDNISSNKKREGSLKKRGWSMLKNKNFSTSRRPSLNKKTSWKKCYQKVNEDQKGDVKNIETLKKGRKKFNYEKYLKYLEFILDTIGYSVAGVLVTWDRALFFCVILTTLVGVFAQAAFLK